MVNVLARFAICYFVEKILTNINQWKINFTFTVIFTIFAIVNIIFIIFVTFVMIYNLLL